MGKRDKKVEQNHQQFLQEVCQSNRVWTLKHPDGYAVSFSSLYVDEDGNGLPMFSFWSSKKWANACAVNEWEGYDAEAISLSDFIEYWCVGLANDDRIAHTNFDQELGEGHESEPLMLILELTAQLKHLNKKNRF